MFPKQVLVEQVSTNSNSYEIQLKTSNLVLNLQVDYDTYESWVSVYKKWIKILQNLISH